MPAEWRGCVVGAELLAAVSALTSVEDLRVRLLDPPPDPKGMLLNRRRRIQVAGQVRVQGPNETEIGDGRAPAEKAG